MALETHYSVKLSSLKLILMFSLDKTSGGSRGATQAMAPSSALSNFFRVRKIISYDRASSANFFNIHFED